MEVEHFSSVAKAATSVDSGGLGVVVMPRIDNLVYFAPRIARSLSLN